MADRKSVVASLMRSMQVPEIMEKRKKKLDAMSNKKMMGGLFDIIYKKRREREKAVFDIENI